MRNTKIITFAPSIAFATLKAVSLQLTGMLMMRKIQQAMQGDAIWARIHPAFIPVTGMKSHMEKFPARLPRSRLEKTEISGTEPARPVIWTHRGKGNARSRKPGSYEEDLKKFDLLLRVFLHVLKSKKIATQVRTRIFRILISLPYHYTTTKGDPPKFRKFWLHTLVNSLS